VCINSGYRQYLQPRGELVGLEDLLGPDVKHPQAQQGVPQRLRHLAPVVAQAEETRTILMVSLVTVCVGSPDRRF
jgi:hypothetical protein